MKSRLVDLWIHLRASYWFIPSLMAIVAILTAIGLVHLDTRLGDSWLRDYQWLYANQPAGARALLSTVAGSMITVAGVTFSMTLLAVSHASAQIGPRLLAGFMRDRGNQLTLGTFIATFLYCLMVLRTVHADAAGGQEDAVSTFVPNIAILVAVSLAILSVVVLIYFIHHVPQSISVANVVARVGDELLVSVRLMYPERIGHGETDRPQDELKLEEYENYRRLVSVKESCGYLRVLDAEGLMDLTVKHDLIVELHQRPGDFGIAGQSLLEVRSTRAIDDELEAELCSLFSWGNERTQEQDVMFPADQLVEVLGKAMSPGVNGQYTALLCLNQLERTLAELFQRPGLSRQRFDSDGKLRVIARPVTQEEFFAGIMRPIRQFIRDDWIVTTNVVDMLQRLLAMPGFRKFWPMLTNELADIRKEVENGAMTPAEKGWILEGSGVQAEGTA